MLPALGFPPVFWITETMPGLWMQKFCWATSWKLYFLFLFSYAWSHFQSKFTGTTWGISNIQTEKRKLSSLCLWKKAHWRLIQNQEWQEEGCVKKKKRRENTFGIQTCESYFRSSFFLSHPSSVPLSFLPSLPPSSLLSPPYVCLVFSTLKWMTRIRFLSDSSDHYIRIGTLGLER